MMDRSKMSKVLALMGSAVDGEALAALRAATRMLVKENLTWEEALFGKERRPANNKGRGATSEAPSFVRPTTGMTLAQQVEFANKIKDQLGLGGRTFVTVITAQWNGGKGIVPPHNQSVLAKILDEWSRS